MITARLLRSRWALALLLAALAVGCGSPSDEASPSPTPTSAPASSTATPAATSPVPPTETAAVTTATPAPTPWDVRARRLTIPALGIDTEVVGSEVVPNTSTVPPGCPTPAPGSTTLTVPNEGVATSEEGFEGLENTAWVFGHSRWQGQPGLLHALERIAVGDEVLVEGVSRVTGAPIAERLVVEGVYLADKDSGGALVRQPRSGPTLILQTSVRESGPNRPWLLDRGQLAARAENLVAGDLEDPCKYLLLFVVAVAS